MPRAPFVGRRAELEAVEAAFAATREGYAVTVLVDGESGVGKTHLSLEFVRRFRSREDVLLLEGRCYERESVPYKALDGVIDDLTAFLTALDPEETAALLPESASLLKRVFPVLDQVPAVAAVRPTQSDVQNPQAIRARVFAELRELFVRVASKRRLVVTIDDLQWADLDSLALLAELLRPPSPPLLLVATVRNATTRNRRQTEVLEAVSRLPGDVRHLHLDTLPAPDARALAEQLVAQGSVPLSPADVDAILVEAHGHPLFLDELVRHRHAHVDAAAPARLDDAVWDRATRLPSSERRVLELVAVAGMPLSQETIARAAALDFGPLSSLVSTLRAEHFVRTSGVYRSDTVEPYHDRVRESVLAHLTTPARQALHAHLAEALEAASDRDLELLLTHWEGAGEHARAAGYAAKAADQAAEALAFDHAAELYRLAIDLAAHAPAEALALKRKLAEALTNAGRGAEAAAVYLEAAADQRDLVSMDLRRRAAEELICSGHMEEGIRTLDAVFADAGIRTPRSPAAILASILFNRGVLAARGLRFTPRPAAEIDPRALFRVDLLGTAGSYSVSDHMRGHAFMLRTALEALRLGEPTRAARSIALYVATSTGDGTKSTAKQDELLAYAEQVAREVQRPEIDALALVARGFVRFFSGDYREAKDALEAAETLLREACIGYVYELSVVRALQWRALAHLGELDSLARRAATTQREAEQRGNRYVLVSVHVIAGVFLALMHDDADAARAELDAASSYLTKAGFHVQHAHLLFGELNLALYRGSPEAMEAHLAARRRDLERSMLLRNQFHRINLADVSARAALHFARRGGSGAAQALTTAAEHARALENERHPHAVAAAALYSAAIAHLRGGPGREEAHVLLRRAVAAYERIGLVIHAAAAKRRLADALGGTEGDALGAAAEASMRACGVVSPARATSFFAPGF
jgi:hypothetical protein